MAEPQYKFNVKMTCSGCSGAISRVLEKTYGVGPGRHTEDRETQEVVVTPDPKSFDPEKIAAKNRELEEEYKNRPENKDKEDKDKKMPEDRRVKAPTYKTVLKAIDKTGKTINSGEDNGKEMPVSKDFIKSEENVKESPIIEAELDDEKNGTEIPVKVAEIAA